MAVEWQLIIHHVNDFPCDIFHGKTRQWIVDDTPSPATDAPDIRVDRLRESQCLPDSRFSSLCN